MRTERQSADEGLAASAQRTLISKRKGRFSLLFCVSRRFFTVCPSVGLIRPKTIRRCFTAGAGGTVAPLRDECIRRASGMVWAYVYAV